MADGGAELALLRAPHEGVDAVGADDEIGVGNFIDAFDSVAIDGLYSDGTRALLQQLQQLQAAQSAAKPTPSMTIDSPR